MFCQVSLGTTRYLTKRIAQDSGRLHHPSRVVRLPQTSRILLYFQLCQVSPRPGTAVRSCDPCTRVRNATSGRVKTLSLYLQIRRERAALLLAGTHTPVILTWTASLPPATNAATILARLES
jgi:uncharacterized membrane protein